MIKHKPTASSNLVTAQRPVGLVFTPDQYLRHFHVHFHPKYIVFVLRFHGKETRFNETTSIDIGGAQSTAQLTAFVIREMIFHEVRVQSWDLEIWQSCSRRMISNKSVQVTVLPKCIFFK